MLKRSKMGFKYWLQIGYICVWLQFSQSLLVDVPIKCEMCSSSECQPGLDPLVRCPIDDKYWCITKIENFENGERKITKGCASDTECHSKWWEKAECISFRPTTNYTFPFTCSYCCSTPRCNSHLFPHMMSLYTGMVTSTTYTTHKPTTASTTTPKPVDCEVCSGRICGLIPRNDPVQTCPSSRPYCMNTVVNADTGQKTYTKRCANNHDCQTKWWEESSDETKCMDFNAAIPYFFQFTCSYCCVTSGCNSKIFPDPHTLFQGKS